MYRDIYMDNGTLSVNLSDDLLKRIDDLEEKVKLLMDEREQYINWMNSRHKTSDELRKADYTVTEF
jgi:hypothetical protein